MVAPAPEEVRQLLVMVLADLVELQIEPTALAVIARATDRTSDQDLIRALAAVAQEAASVWAAGTDMAVVDESGVSHDGRGR